MSDKTEAPSPRRLQRARDEGNVPVSSALTQAAVLIVAFVLVPSTLTSCVLRVTQIIRAAFSAPPPAELSTLLATSGRAFLESIIPLLLACAATAGVLGFVQTGAVFAPARLAPDLSKLSPFSLFKSIFSTQRAFAVFRALFGMLLVAYLLFERLKQHAADLLSGIGNPGTTAHVALFVSTAIARDTVFVVIALGIADLAVTRYSWMKGLLMSKQELKQEHKESEGDPQLKAARERAHHEMLSAASVNAVRDATVVIVNPTHLANALRYDPDRDDSPKLLSKGEGELAAQIIRAAQDYGIPVVQDIPLARAIFELSEGDGIPPELYEAVAAILQEIWEADPSLAPKE